jgi:hypothetical protein
MKRTAIVRFMPDIARVILTVRGHKVILSTDLAAIYGVTTRRLNEQVKRNSDRFPTDFAFQLTPAEKAEVVANCDHLARLHVKEDAIAYRTRKPLRRAPVIR